MSDKQVRFEELPMGEQPGPPSGPTYTPSSPATNYNPMLGRRAYHQSETDLNHIAMPYNPIERTIPVRPLTSNAFRVPFNLSDPIGPSHYDEEFNPKYTGKAEPLRTGTSSGNRSNNPHPSQEFMVFRFRPYNPSSNPNCDWSQPIGDKLISQIIKNQMKSTYKSDFVNNVEEKKKFEERARMSMRPSMPARMAEWKRERESEMDKTWNPMQYNHPFKYESLNIAPTRFGSNKLHGCQTPAYGIVPSCSSFWHDHPANK